MTQPDRPRLHGLLALYATLALAWVGFARWVVPPLLQAESAGRTLAAVRRSIQDFAGPIPTEVLDCWRAVSGAVLMVAVLHLTIVVSLRRHDERAAQGRSPTDLRMERRASLALAIIALAFLATTVLSGTRQDYYFYLRIWYEVRQGHDPWFAVPTGDGFFPLNAYGPLFNLLAGLTWVNPLAPKLLFAYAYVLFAVTQIKRFTVRRPPSLFQAIGLTVWFWNPFPWIEIAVQGHFDVLVALCCLAAIRAMVREQESRSGTWLALGVLLKYIPIVLLPFLAIDRSRIRVRFLAVALASIILGLALSCHVWGLSTLWPLSYAVNRASRTLSIFRYLRGVYSPLKWFGIETKPDELATPLLILALLRAWVWAWMRRPAIEGSAVVAATTTVLLYRVGYPQYQMVPFVLASSWVLGHWGHLRARTFLVAAMVGYFGWLAGFDIYYSLVDDLSSDLYWGFLQELVGLPTFLLGFAFLDGVVRSLTPGEPGSVARAEARAWTTEEPRVMTTSRGGGTSAGAIASEP